MPKLLEEVVVNLNGERVDRIFILYDVNGKVINTFVNESEAIIALKAELNRDNEIKNKIHSDLGIDGDS